MTQEQEDLVIKRQELMLERQTTIMAGTHRLTVLYILIFLIGCLIASILWLNRGTTQSNGQKLDNIERAIRETGPTPERTP